MRQSGAMSDNTLEIKEHNKNDLQKEAPVINMIPNADNSMQVVMAKVNGATVNGKEYYQQNQEPQPRIRRSLRLRL